MSLTLLNPHISRARPALKPSARGRFDGLRARWKRILFGVAALAYVPATAQATFLSGETLDKAADVIALIALFLVPAIVIALFLYVHVLPEKIAERRQHPQKTAIKTLCLLSLAFGGLLWPLAWLWAYSRPVVYKLAYGTEKHEDYFKELHEQAEKGDIAPVVINEVRKELDELAARGQLTPELRAVRDRIAILQSVMAPQATQGESPPVETQPAPARKGRKRGAA